MSTNPVPARRPDVNHLELVGGIERRQIILVEHQASWAQSFNDHSAVITAAVGPAALRVEHIGSTSIPGLAAKPILDILLVVPDITAEEDYLPQLLGEGYVLRVREPGHRMLRTPERDLHLHILQTGDPAASDYLLLRDWLRSHPGDRALYEATKRELASRDWPDMNAYADAKTDVIEAIKARARAAL